MTAPRVNAVVNPSAETGTLDWSLSGGTLSRSTDTTPAQVPGSYVFTCVATSTSSMTLTQTTAVPVTPGQTVSLSVYAKRWAGTRNVTLAALWQDGTTSSDTVTALSTSWTRPDFQVTVPAGKTSVRLRVTISTGAANDQVRLDGFMVESAALGAYFDGSSTDSGGWFYEWSGSAHNSYAVAYAPVLTATLDRGLVRLQVEDYPTRWAGGSVPSVTRQSSTPYGFATVPNTYWSTDGLGRLNLVDYDLPFTAPTTLSYTVSEGGVSAFDSVTWIPGENPGVLVPVTAPDLAVTLELVTAYTDNRDQGVTVHRVIGRADPAVTIAPSATREGELTLWASDYAHADAVDAVLARRDVFLLRGVGTWTETMHLVPVSRRLTAEPSQEHPDAWTVAVSFVEVARPAVVGA